jgi:hypothetical protein
VLPPMMPRHHPTGPWSRPGCSPGAGGDAVMSSLRPVSMSDEDLAGTVLLCGGQGYDTA